jgi:hypothetical protein
MRRIGRHQSFIIARSPGRLAAAMRRSVIVLALGVFLAVGTGFAEAVHLVESAPDHHSDECKFCIALLTAKAATVVAESATPVVEGAVRSDAPAPPQFPLTPRTHEPLAPRAPPGR